MRPGWSDDGLRNAMLRGCRFAEIAAFGPHALRHRYITRLVLAGVPMPLVREIVGHARASMTLDVYSHAARSGEPVEGLVALRAAVDARYRGSPGGYPIEGQEAEKPLR